MEDRLRILTGQFLAQRHHLMAFIHALVGNEAVVEDIFQEVWLAVARAASDEQVIEDMGKWCRQVARHQVFNHWRARQRSKVVVDSRLVALTELAFDEHSPEDREPTRRQALVSCLDGLADEARELLRLTYEQNLAAQDVATRTGRTAAGVQQALSRLRRALGKCIVRRLQQEGRS